MCLAAAPTTSLSLSGMKLPSVSDTLGGAPRHKPGNIKRPSQDGLLSYIITSGTCCRLVFPSAAGMLMGLLALLISSLQLQNRCSKFRKGM